MLKEFDFMSNEMKQKMQTLGLEERATKLFKECQTIEEIFESDPHLELEHLNRVRRFARIMNEAGALDMDNLTLYLKRGLIFIELFYEYILANNKDIEPRPSQVLGSKLMYVSHYFKGHFIGEYPTGSGKSFMYLVYAAALFYNRGERTTVVTAGINLQEQLDGKDMPYISAVYKDVTGIVFPYALIKGRQNYACNKKLEKLFEMVDARIQVVGISNEKQFYDYLSNIPRKNFNGDLSLIDAQMNIEIKEALTVRDAKSGGCAKCELKPQCYFYKRSNMSKTSAVTIINYHVFYMEFEKIRQPGYLSGGLPASYVFDEAHEFAVIGRDFSERAFGEDVIYYMGAKLSHVEEMSSQSGYSRLKGIQFSKFCGIDLRKDLEALRKNYIKESKGWYDNLSLSSGSAFSNDLILPDKKDIETGSVIFDLLELSKNINEVVTEIIEATGYSTKESLYAVSMESDDDQYDIELSMVDNLEELEDNLSEYIMILRKFQSALSRNSSSVYWLSKDEDSKVEVKMKSIDLHTLDKFTKERKCSSVSVSATLAVNDNFMFYRNAVGFTADDVSYEIIGESPFNLFKQELWYLPPTAISGKGAAEGYDAIVASEIIELLTVSKGGALVLFTSKKSMDYCYNIVAAAMPSLMIYKQNKTSKRILLQKFTNDINSVLFANRSFFTGVDIKGPSLRLIILDKLPFENPSDPVSRVLGNRPNGFANYAIPTMVTTLKQIIGRGIRSTDDKCAIAFMDNRLKISNYAPIIRASFINGSNRSRRTEKIEDVASFFDGVFAEYGRDIFESNLYDEEDPYDFSVAPSKPSKSLLDFNKLLKNK